MGDNLTHKTHKKSWRAPTSPPSMDRCGGEEREKLENPYFDLQAEMGITKHLGGLKTTEKLIELCHINKDKYVIDVGCGVGMTACYLAKKIGSRVVGVDISERMIDRSNERAKRGGVENRVEFLVADVQNLPFKNAVFDAVISESVTAFPEDKQKAVNEYVQIVKSGGYIGLNETTWIKTPPKELIEYVFDAIGGCEPETPDASKELLKDSGLRDIAVKTYKIALFSQFVNEIRMICFTEFFKAGGRLFSLYFKRSAYKRVIKKMIKEARHIPKNMFEYFGYGIYVGRK